MARQARYYFYESSVSLACTGLSSFKHANKMEKWIKVSDRYEVSNKGNARSLDMIVNYGDGRPSYLKKGRLLKCSIGSHGYRTVEIDGKKTVLHRVIASAFIPNPENKPTVNHIDGVKTNNDISNLEWATYSENNKHAYSNGLTTNGLLGKTGSKCKNSKKTLMLKDRKPIRVFGSASEAQRITGISHITSVCRGERNHAGSFQWKYI